MIVKKKVEMNKRIAELMEENRKLTDSVTAKMTDEEYNAVERRCTEIHHKIDDLIVEAYN